MTIHKDAEGNRSISVEVEVPGTPEEVWHAIATGPGITAWFAPTEVEEREGGRILFHMGPGMDSTATITAWEPPHRLAAVDESWLPNTPPLATEWTVESRSGDTCVVRVVHSLFTTSDDWDDQLESIENGWPGFFRILRIYLSNFSGEPCSSISLMGGPTGTEKETWTALAEPLGLVDARVGERRGSVSDDAPRYEGVVEYVGEGRLPHSVFLRLTEPAPGAASLGAYTHGGMIFVAVTLYLYGDTASDVATREEPRWQAWIADRFPMAGMACGGATEAKDA